MSACPRSIQLATSPTFHAKPKGANLQDGQRRPVTQAWASHAAVCSSELAPSILKSILPPNHPELTPPKTNMTMKNPPFDVFPIENGDFSTSC